MCIIPARGIFLKNTVLKICLTLKPNNYARRKSWCRTTKTIGNHRGQSSMKHPENGSEKFNRIEYTKGNITKNTNRKDNECWTAGTPVTWEETIHQRPNQSRSRLQEFPTCWYPGIETGKITEYHPVITFFNEIMAQIMRDGHRDVA